jgi:glycosyltransferase involved in cell wall biosynthesis
MAAKDKSGDRRVISARAAFANVLASLPEGLPTALVAYGHRLPREPKAKSCEDMEVVIPFGPLDHRAMLAEVDRFQPKGQTPIGRSLALLGEHIVVLPEQKRTFVVLITDGEETCNAEPNDQSYPVTVVEALRSNGVEAIVNIVGFDIDDVGIQADLEAIARAGDGIFVSAGNAEELAAAIRSALAVPYEVLDGAGRSVAQGLIDGPALPLPSGQYRLRINGDVPVTVDDVAVERDQPTTLVVHAEGQQLAITRK